MRFPPDYRQFLFSYNGGEFNEPVIRSPSDEFPEAAVWFMYGLNAVEPTTELARPFDLALFDDNSPPQVLRIGSTPMGHLILLITHPDPADYGTVGFKMAFGASYFLANGINDFLRCCVSHERSIRGKQKKGGEGPLTQKKGGQAPH